MKQTRDDAWLLLPVRFYQGLVVTLPKDFRDRYSQEIVQVFRDTCRQAYSNRGRSGVLGKLTRGTGDLLVSAVKERFTNLFNDDRRMLILLTISLLSVGAGLFAALTELRSNEVPGSLFMVLMFSFVLGFLRPSSFLLSGLLIGLMLPAMYLVVRTQGWALPYETDDSTPIWALLTLIPALIGSLSGGAFRWFSNYVSNRLD